MSPHLHISPWGARFLGRRMPCAVGRGGIGQKCREGDGITPRGRWRITAVWVRPDRRHLAIPKPYQSHTLSRHDIGLRDAWSDDPADPAYNTAILRDERGEEQLRRPDPLYDLIAVLDYNVSPVKPGAGSAIFLHSWRKPRHPTAGCVAFAPADLEWILERWHQNSRVVIA